MSRRDDEVQVRRPAAMNMFRLALLLRILAVPDDEFQKAKQKDFA